MPVPAVAPPVARRRALLAAAAAALASAALAPSALGQTQWTGTAGDRKWTTGTNWNPAAVPGDFDIPTFTGASPGLVDLNGTIQPAGAGAFGYSGLNFTGTGGYSIANGTLLLPGGGVTQNSTGVNTISAVVSSSGAGGGIWTIQSGTLALANTSTTTPNSFGSSTVFNISTGGTLRASGAFTGGSNAIAGVDLNLQGGTFAASGTAVTTANALQEVRYAGIFGTTRLNPISTGTGALAQAPTSIASLTGPLSFNQAQLDAKAGQADNYTIVWRGKVTVASTGTYSFGTASDDGSVVYIDKNLDGTFDPSTELVLNSNFDQGTTQRTASTSLTAGTYPIAIGFYENGGGSAMEARVASGAQLTYGSQTVLDPSIAAGVGGMTFSFDSVNTTGPFDYTVGGGGNVNVTTTNSTIVVNAADVTGSGFTPGAKFGTLTMNAGASTNLNVNGGTDAVGSAQFSSLTGSGALTITANTGAVITGAVTNGGTPITSLTKAGTGTLTLMAGSPGLAAPITVSAGILAVGADQALGPGGPTDGATTVASGGQLSLRYANNGTYAAAERVTLNGTGPSNSGALESGAGGPTGGFGSHTFGGVITLGSNAFIVSSTINANLTLTGGVNTAGFEARFGGNGNVTVSGTPITGAGSVRKTESGDLFYAAGTVNTYTGVTNVDAGRLVSLNTNDFATTSGVNVNNAGSILDFQAAGSNLSKVTETNAGAFLRLTADQGGATPGTIPTAAQTGTVQVNADQGANFTTTGTPAGNGLLLGNGSTIYAFGAAARTYASPLRVQGTAQVGNSASFGGSDRTLTVSGVISNGTSAGTLTKIGTDTVNLTATNTYTGGTNVNGGTLNLNAVNAAPTGSTLTASGTGSFANLTVNGAANNVTVVGGGGGVVQVGAGVTTPGFTGGTFRGGGELRFNQGAGVTATSTATAIGVDGGIVHAQTGVADLSAAVVTGTPVQTIFGNSFAGRLYEANSGGNVRNAIQTLLTTGATNTANLTTSSTPANINFPSDASVGTFFGNTNVANNTTANWSATFTGTFTARVAGTYTFGVDVQDDNSDIYVDTNNNGTFEQTERVIDKTCCNGAGVRTTATVSLPAGTYNFVVANEDTGGGGSMSGVFAEPGGTLQFIAPALTAGGGTLQVDAGAELRVKQFTTIGTIAMTGTGSPAVLTLANNAAPTPSSATALTLAGTNPAGTLNTGGAGNTVTILNVNVATGGTLTVSGAGKVLVNGQPPTGAGTGGVTVTGTATLGGTGRLAGPVTIATGATLSPGTSPGVFSHGSLNLQAGSNLLIELAGTTVGTQYDQDAVTGTVTLGGGNLNVAVGYAPVVGDTFVIINNDGADPVTGTFTTANGSPIVANTFGSNGATFLINYAGATGGADGNDVTLTVTAIPEPAAAGLLAVGAVGLLARRRRRKMNG